MSKKSDPPATPWAMFGQKQPTSDAAYEYVDANIDAMPEEDKSTYIGAGKAISYLMKMEGNCGLERDSVYGAAMVCPQLARSTGYSRSMAIFAIRSYVFLAINIFMQLFLLSMVGEEAHVMRAFAGRMHLCDFGKDIENCPGGPNCIGPGGSAFTMRKLYDYGSWADRMHVQSSLLELFPERSDEIRNVLDPGEYGMENYYCRLLCCFIFMMAVLEDFLKTVDSVLLLKRLPTSAETWVRYEPPAFGTDKAAAKAIHGWTELDLVKFGVAGMPLGWKVANIIFVVVPKFVIWFVLAISGNYFLMETAGIVYVIMNSVALTFIIQLDEIAYQCFTSNHVKHIMENIVDYEHFDVTAEENETDEECLHRFCREEFGANSWCKFITQLSPRRLFYVFFFLALFQVQYYQTNCDLHHDGSYRSKPIYEPILKRLNPISWVLPFKLLGFHEMDEPMWVFPEVTE
jgi:hypothetical protein